jgi:hypothetical protein
MHIFAPLQKSAFPMGPNIDEVVESFLISKQNIHKFTKEKLLIRDIFND